MDQNGIVLPEVVRAELPLKRIWTVASQAEEA